MTGLRAAAAATTTGLAILLGPVLAQAHEFWVEPSGFQIDPGSRIAVRLCVGDGYEGWSLARNAGRIEEFVAAGPAGEQPVVGLDGSDPAGVVRLSASGGHFLVYQSDRAFTELPDSEFDRYLVDKGLEHIVAERKDRGARRGKVREAYSRHSKALVRVGEFDAGVHDRAIGLRLELVAESGLSRADDGDPATFRLLYGGKPLAGALVKAMRPGTADVELSARTGANGRVSFRLPAPGMWRLATVHLIEPPDGIAADWESLWASLTFELPPPAAGGARGKFRAARTACQNQVLAAAVPVRP